MSIAANSGIGRSPMAEGVIPAQIEAAPGLDQYLEDADIQARGLGWMTAEIKRLRVVFDEACNEVRMCHGKPCFCKYCHEDAA